MSRNKILMYFSKFFNNIDNSLISCLFFEKDKLFILLYSIKTNIFNQINKKSRIKFPNS